MPESNNPNTPNNTPAVAKAVTAAPAKTAAAAPAEAKAKAAPAETKTNTVVQQPEKAQKADNQSSGSPWLSMLPFILIFVVMIFFMNRSQKKQMQKRQEMMDKIVKGTKVLLTSGIYGTVEAVHDDFMIVEIASGVKVKVSKNGVAGIDAPEAGEKKAEGK